MTAKATRRVVRVGDVPPWAAVVLVIACAMGGIQIVQTVNMVVDYGFRVHEAVALIEEAKVRQRSQMRMYHCDSSGICSFTDGNGRPVDPPYNAGPLGLPTEPVR